MKGLSFINYDGFQYTNNDLVSRFDVNEFLIWVGEVIKDDYILWVEKASFEESDTFGMLALSRSESKYLIQNHPDWVKAQLRLLPKPQNESKPTNISQCINTAESKILKYWWLLILLPFLYVYMQGLG